MHDIYLLWRDDESHTFRCTKVREIDDLNVLAETMANWSTAILNDYSYGSFISFGPVDVHFLLAGNVYASAVFPAVTTVTRSSTFYIPMLPTGYLDTDLYHVVLDDVPDFSDALFAHGSGRQGGGIFSVDAPFVEMAPAMWQTCLTTDEVYRCISLWTDIQGRTRQYVHWQIDTNEAIVDAMQEYSQGTALGWNPARCIKVSYDQYDSPVANGPNDQARLLFASEAGEQVEIYLPGAPNEIYLPDRRHVDPAKIGGLVEDLLAHGASQSGAALTKFLRGTARRGSDTATMNRYSGL